MTRPTHALDRLCERHGRGGLAVASDRDVVARDPEFAARRRDDDFAFEHDDLREPRVGIDTNVELRAFEPRIGVRSLEGQGARVAADHVNDAAQQLDQGVDPRRRLGKVDDAALVELERPAVGQDQRRAARAFDANEVVGADPIAGSKRHPGGRRAAPYLDASFDDADLGRPSLAAARGIRVADGTKGSEPQARDGAEHRARTDPAPHVAGHRSLRWRQSHRRPYCLSRARRDGSQYRWPTPRGAANSYAGLTIKLLG